jgi:hypothetical protein
MFETPFYQHRAFTVPGSLIAFFSGPTVSFNVFGFLIVM